MSNLIADALEREQALDPLRSFCVTAPAGSGKTELLIQRYLCLLARVEQPESVLAITFTRKAAAEMRERVIQSLHRGQESQQPESEHEAQTWLLARRALDNDRHRGWDLTLNPGRMNIRTIDGFCAGLTRQLPILSGFGGAVAAADHSETAYRMAVKSLLAKLGTEHSSSEDIARLALGFDGNWQRIEDMLVQMLGKREQWLLHLGAGLERNQAQWVIESSVERLVADTLGPLRSKCEPWQEEIVALHNYRAANVGLAHWDSFPGPDALASWIELADMLLTTESAWRKRLDKNLGFPAGKGEAAVWKQRCLDLIGTLSEETWALPGLSNLRHLPLHSPDDKHWQLLLSASRLLPLLAAELAVVFQEMGEVDHSQVSMAAIHALGNDEEPTELALKLGYQLHHVLVDEFQDTAVNQFELVRRLSRGWAEHNAENPAAPNTLFIVGDGMQSIYGFRDADVGLFLKARAEGFNGVKLDSLVLKSNFRSDPALVEWVNRVGQAAFPAYDDVQRGIVSFSAAAAERSPGVGSGCELALFEHTGTGESEAVWVADQIESGLCDSDCESIAVLVRSRPHLHAIVQELRAREISWRAQDIDPLAMSLVVRDLMSLWRALHNFADRLSWFALFRAPWAALELADLLALEQHLAGRPPWPALIREAVTGLSEHGERALARVLPILSRSLQRREKMSARVWLEQCWLELGGPACVEHASELQDAQAFFELLEEFDQRSQQISLPELELAVDKLYSTASDPQSKVQLMTLHKAKGLEFDWVIIPGLARQSRSADRPLLMVEEYFSPASQELGLLFAVNDAAEKEVPTLYNYLHQHRKMKQQHEALRLLYVGLTRARQRLLLSAELRVDDADGGWKSPSGGALLASIWPYCKAQAVAPEVSAHNVESIPGSLLQVTQFPEAANVAAAQSSDERLDGPPLIRQDPLARQIGTVVHETLQRLSGTSEEDLIQLDITAWEPWWLARLRQQPGGVADSEAALERIRHHISTTLSDEKGRFVLSRSGKDARAEYAVSCLDENGRVQELIIDRVYSENECCWVVDYKTAMPDSATQLEEFIDRERETYLGQLQRYRRSMAALTSLPIKTALYFTGISYWLEVD